MGAALVGLVGLLGYLTGTWSLGALRPGYVPMAPSTASCFLILGFALFRHARRPWQDSGLLAMLGLSALVVVWGLLIGAGIGATLEERLFPSPGTAAGYPIGRMSPVTAATFVAAGLSACLLLPRSRSSRLAQQYVGHSASTLGLVVALVGATFLLAYMYGAPLLYGGTIIPMSATTAIAFVCLGTALVTAAGPDCFPIRYVTGDSTSARLSRVFLPFTVAVVLIAGAASSAVAASAVLSQPLVLAALAVALVAITAGLIARLAQSFGGALDESNRTLRESQELLSRMVLHSPIYCYIRRVTPTESRFVHASNNFQQIIGVAGPDMVGKTMGELFPPGIAAKLTADDWGVVATGEGVVVEQELNGRRYSSIKFPVPQSSGVLLAGYTMDITERKLAEEALQKSEARLQRVINATKDGIWEWDIQTGLEYFSPRWCEIIGYSYDDPELPHTFDSWASRVHPDDRDRVFVAFQSHLDSGSAYDVVYRHRHGSGDYRWQNSRGARVLDENGKPIKMVGCTADITERKEAEAQREALLASLQEALANVRTLSGLLPICAGCKKIRDEQGSWSQMEVYVARHSDARFSHGMCPDCLRIHYPDQVTEAEE